MKLQMTSHQTNVVAFAEQELANFNQYISSQAIKVVDANDHTEESNGLGLLVFRGGAPIFGVRIHARMAAVTPAIHLGPRLLVIAYDDHLLGIDLESVDCVVDITLGSPFREVIEMQGGGCLCVVTRTSKPFLLTGAGCGGIRAISSNHVGLRAAMLWLFDLWTGNRSTSRQPRVSGPSPLIDREQRSVVKRAASLPWRPPDERVPPTTAVSSGQS